MYENYFSGPWWFIWLAITVLMIVSIWKVFVKAGKPGWGCLIPIYNLYLLVEIAGKRGWWLLLFLIPGVNLVIWIIINLEVAKKFGKGTGFGVGLFLLGFIFYPILGLGNAKYKKGGKKKK